CERGDRKSATRIRIAYKEGCGQGKEGSGLGRANLIGRARRSSEVQSAAEELMTRNLFPFAVLAVGTIILAASMPREVSPHILLHPRPESISFRTGVFRPGSVWEVVSATLP